MEIVRAGAVPWPDILRLFGPAGASNGCWCQYWLLGPDYHRRDRKANRDDLHHQVDADRAGIVALSDGEPVGWARLTHRSQLGYLTRRFARYPFPDDDPLSLACFSVRPQARGGGVMSALIDGALREADRAKSPLEAYSIDPAAPSATKNRFSGILPVFLLLGFTEIGRLSEDRAVVRSD
ncbi:GNAT family N-acetyltransferase [Leifsonia sp. 21MFCrub1.1]|uniref:GNAT family N-acetyltransferase n=1 Tax=Leifsonia sp. 21MFCrub1.1 TaxID=1798223 RepID=UPI000892A2EF|nr:GNAT family N-acetyltransferase [Leifsonia sp. 21MFCrub1.1]SEA52951.1 Acetyltransferase (GNAT) domain-containing protein [Leifsonia sp. 21MFCrub1.1]